MINNYDDKSLEIAIKRYKEEGFITRGIIDELIMQNDALKKRIKELDPNLNNNKDINNIKVEFYNFKCDLCQSSFMITKMECDIMDKEHTLKYEIRSPYHKNLNNKSRICYQCCINLIFKYDYWFMSDEFRALLIFKRNRDLHKRIKDLYYDPIRDSRWRYIVEAPIYYDTINKYARKLFLKDYIAQGEGMRFLGMIPAEIDFI